MPLSTLIEQNNDPVDVNFVSRNNFNNNAYRGNFNARPFPGNSSNNYGNPYGNYVGERSMGNKKISYAHARSIHGDEHLREGE